MNPQLDIIRRSIPYIEDVSASIRHLETTAPDGYAPETLMLLESADITTRAGINSIAILAGSLRLTCNAETVEIETLSETGNTLREFLAEEFQDNIASDSHNNDVHAGAQNGDTHDASGVVQPLPDSLRITFTPSEEIDERQRLLSTSTFEPLRRLQQTLGKAQPEFTYLGGGVAYDYLASFEDLPDVAESTNTHPDYQFVLAEILLTVDHAQKTTELIGIAHPDQLDALAADLDEISAVLKTKPNATRLDDVQPSDGQLEPDQFGVVGKKFDENVTATTNFSDTAFREVVEDLRGAIYQGEIYQVVPARGFQLDCPDALAAYTQLKKTNPSPYMFFQRGTGRDGAEYELFGASPESNLKYDSTTRHIQLYPIAGTRPRGFNPDGTISHELDIRAELDMRTDAKEISEHTMLVDLARNDLARIAVPGSRKVADLLQVDRYSHVMHLVSRVVATLHPDFDAFDAYRACMNMGTLTGAPKIRATELLRQAEGQRRGSYGGAVGYVRGNGDMDTCIVIRSAFVRNGVATVQAGAGVVKDSNPQSEANETLHKARAVLEAIATAQGKNLEVTR